MTRPANNPDQETEPMTHLTLRRSSDSFNIGYGTVLTCDSLDCVRASATCSAVLPSPAEVTLMIRAITHGESEVAPGDWPRARHTGTALSRRLEKESCDCGSCHDHTADSQS